MRFAEEAPDLSSNQLVNFITGRHRRLAHTRRYNTTPLTRQETVAEHSFFVTVYARILCEYISHIDINRLKVMEKALFHDSEESISGDIIWTFKHKEHLSKEIDKINEKMIEKVFPDIHKKDYYVDIWKNAKDNTIEGRTVDLADKMSVLSFVFEEIKLGNNFIKPIWHNQIKVMREYAKEKYFGFLTDFLDEIERVVENE